LKNCVKLPSEEAEPETPGEEKPFIRGAALAGGADSITVFA
jgi:hypothetical protein